MHAIATVLRAIAPWIWLGTCGFGIFISLRLAWFAWIERRKLRLMEADTEAVPVLTHLYRLAIVVLITLFGLIIGGVASITRPIGDDLSRIILLVVLLATPGVLTWIAYRAFWIQFGTKESQEA